MSNFILIHLLSYSFTLQTTSLWSVLAKAKFKDVYVKEFGMNAQILVPDKAINALHNSIVEVSGYHIPVEEPGLVILSKYPNSSCFFCGAAGLESIMEIRPKNRKHRRYKMDDKLKFTGRLKLNIMDWEQLSFILVDAEEIK